MEKLQEAIKYISVQTTALCKKVTNNEYPIGYLTIFSHYPKEFEKLKEMALRLGKIVGDHNGPIFRLHSPIKLISNDLAKIRVRKPDPYRLHVGCTDFIMPSYDSFKKTFLRKNPNNLRLIKRPEFEMIEFFDPDYDVLAYVLNTKPPE